MTWIEVRPGRFLRVESVTGVEPAWVPHPDSAKPSPLVDGNGEIADDYWTWERLDQIFGLGDAHRLPT